MSAIDIIILLFVTIAAILGIKRGFIVQIFSFIGIIVGIIACRLFGYQLANYFTSPDADIATAYLCSAFANLLLFAGALILAKIVGHLIKFVAKALTLSFLDRLGGAIFCIFEWLLILSILLNVWQGFRPNDSLVANARLLDGKVAEHVLGLAPTVFGSDLATQFFDTLTPDL